MDEQIQALIARLPLRNTAPETVLPEGSAEERGVRYHPGQTIADGYIVQEQIGEGGAQANIYLAQRQGTKCVIKVYRSDYHPDEELAELLKTHSCPYLTPLLEYGYAGEHFYEVYEYYEKGSLENRGSCNYAFLRDVVIPSVNEGLRFLHTLGKNGIVHGDLKPGNLFLSDDEKRVLIGDFGISSEMDGRGHAIGGACGTPEYAPRTVGFFGQARRSSAYDYGSFGLVLIRLATGHSLFEGLSLEGIAKMWDEGITVPRNMHERLHRLIEGLLLPEEKRFGYEEVQNWCKGEFISSGHESLYTPEDFDEHGKPESMIFGIFDRAVLMVGTPEELGDAIVAHWEQGKRLLRNESLFSFLRQFSAETEKQVREYSTISNRDHALFYSLYAIAPRENLIYQGQDFGTAEQFAEALVEGGTEAHREIIRGGLFRHFLSVRGYPEALLSFVDQLLSEKSCDRAFAPMVLFYSLSGREKRFYEIDGEKVYSVDDLVPHLAKRSPDEVEALTRDVRLLAWLYVIGYRDRILTFFSL